MRGLVVAVAITLSTLLTLSGSAKLFSAAPLSESLAVAFPPTRKHFWRQSQLIALVRVIAALELTCAGLSCFRPTSQIGAYLGITIGVGILLFVLVLRARKIQVPCGCFGVSGDRPTGLTNGLAGIALIAGYGLAAVNAPATTTSPRVEISIIVVLMLIAVMSANYARVLRALHPKTRAA